MVKSNTVTVTVKGVRKPPEWIKYMGLLVPATVIVWYLLRGRRGGR